MTPVITAPVLYFWEKLLLCCTWRSSHLLTLLTHAPTMTQCAAHVHSNTITRRDETAHGPTVSGHQAEDGGWVPSHPSGTGWGYRRCEHMNTGLKFNLTRVTRLRSRVDILPRYYFGSWVLLHFISNDTLMIFTHQLRAKSEAIFCWR